MFQFDESVTQLYAPQRVIKQAVLVPVPEDTATTITAEWGEAQSFTGPWYAFYSSAGKILYGSARTEFDETHMRTDEVENGCYKVTPIEAYKHHGEPIEVITVLADGTVETTNVAHDGDWIVRWPHGEVGVIKDAKFRTLYNVDD